MDDERSHFVTGRALDGPWDERFAIATFGMGCFWGVERLFWPLDGVWVTAVGYAGGHTERPDYQTVCGGRTGHAEIVRVVFDPNRIRYEDLLRVFWENHDPTQGMRQGNDVGSQYRSLIVASDATQRALAESSRDRFAELLASAGFGRITTEIVDDVPFWMAEEYHQQYLAKNPNGYCGIAGTGVACPVGIVG